jgi:hypothetical protein
MCYANHSRLDRMKCRTYVTCDTVLVTSTSFVRLKKQKHCVRSAQRVLWGICGWCFGIAKCLHHSTEHGSLSLTNNTVS